MPVLEPITSGVPNYKVLGYEKDEIIWMGAGDGNMNGNGGSGNGNPN